MESTEASVGAPSPRECENGYFWYMCTWTTPSYRGCCSLDPCNTPIGCPLSARGQSDEETIITVTSTLPDGITTTFIVTSSQPEDEITVTETSISFSSIVTLTSTRATQTRSIFSTFLPSTASSLPTPTPGASAPTSPAISSTSTAVNENGGGNGMTIPVSTLVGIVIGCSFAAIFVTLSACMWWSRRRRRKNEKRQEQQVQAQAERLPSSGGIDEPVPAGLESVFNPMAQSGPGSIFDRTEGIIRPSTSLAKTSRDINVSRAGRMGTGESVLGFGPLAHDHHSSTLTGGVHSSLISPLAPGSSWDSGLSSSPSELDSTPIHGAAGRVSGGTAEFDSRPAPLAETDGVLRATLNSTQQERETGTYANSWTRFQNVQL